MPWPGIDQRIFLVSGQEKTTAVEFRVPAPKNVWPVSTSCSSQASRGKLDMLVTQLCVCRFMYVCMHACVHVCACMCVCIFVCMCVHYVSVYMSVSLSLCFIVSETLVLGVSVMLCLLLMQSELLGFG